MIKTKLPCPVSTFVTQGPFLHSPTILSAREGEGVHSNDRTKQDRSRLWADAIAIDLNPTFDA